MYDEHVMPEALEGLVVALCADFHRRSEVIRDRSAPYNVIMEYRFLNYRMLNAAAEIAGSRDAVAFIGDIGSGMGYAESELWVLSEAVYKERKREVKSNIARRLSLM